MSTTHTTRSLLASLVEPSSPSTARNSSTGIISGSHSVVTAEPARLSDLPELHDEDSSSGPGTIHVFHYNARLDTTGKSLLFVQWMYDQCERDGLLDLYFPQITDDDRRANRALLFNDLMSSGSAVLVLRDTGDPDNREFVGFATGSTLSMGIGKQVGNCGFVFLKKFWDRTTTMQAASRIMQLWLDGVPLRDGEGNSVPGQWLFPPLDVLVGFVADTNRLAMQFMHRMGWTEMLPHIPGTHFYNGAPADTVQWIITREDFAAQGGAQ